MKYEWQRAKTVIENTRLLSERNDEDVTGYLTRLHTLVCLDGLGDERGAPDEEVNRDLTFSSVMNSLIDFGCIAAEYDRAVHQRTIRPTPEQRHEWNETQRARRAS